MHLKPSISCTGPAARLSVSRQAPSGQLLNPPFKPFKPLLQTFKPPFKPWKPPFKPLNPSFKPLKPPLKPQIPKSTDPELRRRELPRKGPSSDWGPNILSQTVSWGGTGGNSDYVLELDVLRYPCGDPQS